MKYITVPPLAAKCIYSTVDAMQATDDTHHLANHSVHAVDAGPGLLTERLCEELKRASLRIQQCHTPDQATVDKYWFCVKKLLESWMC